MSAAEAKDAIARAPPSSDTMPAETPSSTAAAAAAATTATAEAAVAIASRETTIAAVSQNSANSTDDSDLLSELCQRLTFYFSPANLRKDRFLQQEMNKDPDLCMKSLPPTASSAFVVVAV